MMMFNVSWKYWIILEFWNYEIVERISVYLVISKMLMNNILKLAKA